MNCTNLTSLDLVQTTSIFSLHFVQHMSSLKYFDEKKLLKYDFRKSCKFSLQEDSRRVFKLPVYGTNNWIGDLAIDPWKT